MRCAQGGGGPIVLVWENVRLHMTAGMREFIDANAEWLTVSQIGSLAAATSAGSPAP